MARSGWTERRLGDLIEVRHGWPFKSQYFSEALTGRPIVVNIGNFEYTGGFRFGSTAVKEYRDVYPKEYELRPGEILLIMTCQTSGGEILGIPARVPDDGRTYLHNQRLGRVVLKCPNEIDRDYLYWVFLWSEFNRELFVTSTGTKILHTAPTRIENFRFRVPPIRVQRRIADILGTLDDKIKLNRQMNETLEAVARRLFKSWFVDFDPVHAKAGLRRQHPKFSNTDISRRALPNMTPEIAELFPDSFEDSSIGPIPKGWKGGMVLDAIEINPTRSLPKGTVAPWLEMSNMPTRSARALAWEHRAFGSGMKFVNGDTLVARITPCLENGKTAFVDFLNQGQVGAGSTEYIVLRPRAPLPPVYAYLLARTDEFRQHLITNMTGTSGRQRAPADCLNTFPLVTPPKEIAHRFGEATDSLFAQMKTIDEESFELTATRERLLPRLLSGQLRVPEKERIVGRTA